MAGGLEAMVQTKVAETVRRLDNAKLYLDSRAVKGELVGSSRRKASVYLALLFAARGLGVATTIVGVTLTQFGGRYRRTLALTLEEG